MYILWNDTLYYMYYSFEIQKHQWIAIIFPCLGQQEWSRTVSLTGRAAVEHVLLYIYFIFLIGLFHETFKLLHFSFRCKEDDCKELFSSYNNLKKHIIRIHKSRPYKVLEFYIVKFWKCFKRAMIYIGASLLIKSLLTMSVSFV